MASGQHQIFFDFHSSVLSSEIPNDSLPKTKLVLELLTTSHLLQLYVSCVAGLCFLITVGKGF